MLQKVPVSDENDVEGTDTSGSFDRDFRLNNKEKMAIESDYPAHARQIILTAVYVFAPLQQPHENDHSQTKMAASNHTYSNFV